MVFGPLSARQKIICFGLNLRAGIRVGIDLYLARLRRVDFRVHGDGLGRYFVELGLHPEHIANVSRLLKLIVLMHFMLSIETEGVSAERRREILDQLSGAFAGCEFVEAVVGTYVINAEGYGIYEHVQTNLLEVARAIEDTTVRFVMTPLINRGVYHGRMGEQAADRINTLTD